MIACIYGVIPTDGVSEVSNAPDALARANGNSLAFHVALLDVVPRVSTTGAMIWADIRGLPECATIDRLIALLRRSGFSHATIGVAATPIVAEVAARQLARRQIPAAWRHVVDSSASVGVARVSVGDERAFLDPLLLGVLEPDPTLANLLDGAGFEYCRDLAQVSRESVEVRFGAAGARLWRLARGDDDRYLFDVIPRALPESSMAWSEYAIKRVERLVFVLNGLCGAVCRALRDGGEGAMAVTLRFSLANRTVFEHPVRAARPTSSQTVWMRILRVELERLMLPDAVVGIAFRVDALGPLGDKQGDLFDRGFVTASAAEAGLSQVLDDQGDIAVAPHNTRHHLLDRRTEWRPLDATQALDISPGLAHTDPVLTLQLLSRPTRIAVTTIERRGCQVPRTYRDGATVRTIVDAAGPDVVSGEQWHRPYAREYYRCVTTDGQLVWLFRDVQGHGWYLHGWWD